jgi:tetratricopeptide (TPR) repeat protein
MLHPNADEPCIACMIVPFSVARSTGLSIEAAEAVCSGNGLEPADVLDLLTRLVDKSLVGVETQSGKARYRLLETVRQYGRDRLQESDEVNDVRRRHRDWCLTLAEQAAPELWGPRQAFWLARLEREHDNLRGALEWSHAERDGAEAGLRLAGALVFFWIRHGHWSEGREWTESVLARGAEAPPSAGLKALEGAVNFAWRQGDYSRARTLGEKDLRSCRELQDKETSAWFLLRLGQVAYTQEGQGERATALLEESLNLSNERSLIGVVLAELGEVARYQGDYDSATALCNRSLVVLNETGDKWNIASNHRLLGSVALDQGDYKRASAFFVQGLSLCGELGDKYISQQCLQGLARAASGTGHYERAVRLFGAAEVLRETLGFHSYPVDQAGHDQCVISTRAAFGDDAFAAVWAEGRAMTLEQAVEYALNPGLS